MNYYESLRQAAKAKLRNARNNNKATAEDMFNLGITTKNSLNIVRNPIVIGSIIETCIAERAYKVAISGGQAPILCCALQVGGGNPSLLFDSSLYAVGSSVLVMVQDGFGVILGALPYPGTGNDAIIGNYLSHASKNYPDESDRACLSLATDSEPDVGILNFGHGMPVDSTDVGEFGHITATGVKLMLNPFMALMSVDDYTGLWLFDDDSLLRLSGLNLQIRSAGRETEYLNDNGEYIEYSGSCLYPWEQLGYTRRPVSDIILESSESEYLEPDTWKSFVEPYKELSKPFHRRIIYGGWLGQGRFAQTVAPDPQKDWCTFNDKEKYPGLLRTTETVDGYLNSVAASGVFLGKRGLIPAVSRITRPDDTSTEIGDNQDNYSKTNQFTAKQEIPKADKPMETVMGLHDFIAYQQNFKELVPFLQHEKDYYIPEDSELNEGASRFADLSQLNSQQFTSVKEGAEVSILGTERKIKTNPAEAGIACLPDGSEVLYGGCGEEIRMSGGSMFMDAPGDVWIKSGRKLILWAGEDIEIRAKGNIDVSTTDGSIRIKSEGKLSLLGGNNEKDGVLIESKGTSTNYDFNKGGDQDVFGGILFKAANGTIGALGSTIYLRSGLGDGGSGIYLDAKNGEQSVYTICDSSINYIENTFEIDYASLKTGDIDATTLFTKDNVYISGSIYVDGGADIKGTVITGDNIRSGGHIFTAKAKDFSLYVGDDSKSSGKLKEDLEKKSDYVKVKLPQQSIKEYDASIERNLHADNKIATDEVLEKSGFTFRISKEYNIPEDFAVYESRWQNIISNTGSGGVAWKENPVKTDNEEAAYPFPGKQLYTTDTGYVTQAWTLTDYSTGLYKNRWKDSEATPEYKDPKYGEQQKKPLNEYPVIK